MENIGNLEELERRLIDIVRGPGKPTAIIGGHYPITMRGEAETYTDGAFGVFPEYTFGLASRLVAKARENGRDIKIALVVDDHSLMTPQGWYREAEANPEVAHFVKNYFDRFSLPENYRTTLTDNGLDEHDLIRASSEVLPFQESAFRIVSEKERGVPATCAGEYEYVLKNLQRQGIRRVISLIPQRCQGPTCNGAGIFKSRNPDIKITHAYLSSHPSICSVKELAENVREQGGIPFVTFG